MSPEMRPKSLGTFEKRVPGLHLITCVPSSISVTKCPIFGDPGAVGRDGTKKSRAKSGPVRVYKSTNLSTLAGPDLPAPSRLTASR